MCIRDSNGAGRGPASLLITYGASRGTTHTDGAALIEWQREDPCPPSGPCPLQLPLPANKMKAKGGVDDQLPVPRRLLGAPPPNKTLLNACRVHTSPPTLSLPLMRQVLQTPHAEQRFRPASDWEYVSNLVFYAQSTSSVISGRSVRLGREEGMG